MTGSGDGDATFGGVQNGEPVTVFPSRVVLRLDIDNPEQIHPELLRDDIADALCERGFGGFAIDIDGMCECDHPMSEHDQYGYLVQNCCAKKGRTVDA